LRHERKNLLEKHFREMAPSVIWKPRPWAQCLLLAVRPEGANHQWSKIPPRELLIDLEADERLDRVTGWAGAS